MEIRKHITNFYNDATKVPFYGVITQSYYDSKDKTCVVQVECEDGKTHMGIAVDYMGLVKPKPPTNKTEIKYCYKRKDGFPIAFCC